MGSTRMARRADRLHLRLCLGEGNAGPKAGNHRQPMCPKRPRPPAAEQRILYQRYPDLVGLVGEWSAEAGAHHPGDGEGTLIEGNRLARNFLVGAETGAPQVFADDGNRRRAAPAFLGEQSATDQRDRPKQRKEFRGHRHGAHIGRLSAPSESARVAGQPGDGADKQNSAISKRSRIQAGASTAPASRYIPRR
jgi:hypothetical protein